MKTTTDHTPTRCDSPLALSVRSTTEVSTTALSDATVICTALPDRAGRFHKESAASFTQRALFAIRTVSLEHRLLLCLAVVTFIYSAYQSLPPSRTAKSAAGTRPTQQLAPGAAKPLSTPPPASSSQSSEPPPAAAADATTIETLQLQAVQALVSGHRQQALALYQQLATAVPSATEYRAAARILSQKIAPMDKLQEANGQAD